MNRILIQLSRIAAWISQGFNCFVLFGHHDMTVSARLYLNRERKVWSVFYGLVNTIYFWQENHCRGSWLADVIWANEVLESKENEFRMAKQEMIEQSAKDCHYTKK